LGIDGLTIGDWRLTIGDWRIDDWGLAIDDWGFGGGAESAIRQSGNPAIRQFGNPAIRQSGNPQSAIQQSSIVNRQSSIPNHSSMM
jgi:hypothetical protein